MGPDTQPGRAGPPMHVGGHRLTGPVPEVLTAGDDQITVERAWPRGPREDAEVVLVEGRDGQDRIRAARLRMRHVRDEGWEVTSARVAPPGTDPGLPDLAGAARTGTVVVHRYGKRAVVRRPDRYVKVVRPDGGAQVAATAEHGRLVAERAGFAAPAVLEAGSGAVAFSVLPGRSLHELGGVATTAEWSSWWARWAERWTDLARPAPQVEGIPSHTAYDEVVNLRRWLDRSDRMRAFPADVSHQLAVSAARVSAELTEGRAQGLVVSHRDLHDKQVLADGTSLGLLDFDTVSLAEPALDLANLWVHAVLRTDQGLWSRGHSGVVRETILDLADGLGVPFDRFAAYAEATRLRLACLYAFRPRHRAMALDWATRARVTENT